MILIKSPSHSASFNIAAEEYLFSNFDQDILFVYRNMPAVILGCNQVSVNEVDAAYCREQGIDIVRRMSGGGAVYHDMGNLNFCFIYNRTENRPVLSEEFLFPVVRALEDSGIAVNIGVRKDLWIDHEYKITGTASHVGKARELHHGTLLYMADISRLTRALHPIQVNPSLRGIASVRSVVMNISTWLDKHMHNVPSAERFFQDIIQRMKAELPIEYEYQFDDADSVAMNKLATEKYRNDVWTFRK